MVGKGVGAPGSDGQAGNGANWAQYHLFSLGISHRLRGSSSRALAWVMLKMRAS